MCLKYQDKYIIKQMTSVIKKTWKQMKDSTLKLEINEQANKVELILFLQLKELQARQATLLALQQDAERKLASAEEEVMALFYH